MKQLVTTAAFLVAISLAAPSAFALTAAQKAEVKKAVTMAPVPEMPAKAAELVLKAAKQDRAEVAALAVRTAIYKSRGVAPQVVAAIAKAAPELAGVVTMVAVQMEGAEAAAIAMAAKSAAPGSGSEIASSVRAGLQNPTPFTLASATGVRLENISAIESLTTRGSYGGVPTGGVTSTNKPINESSGGDGSGNFPTKDPTNAPPGQVINYEKPRTTGTGSGGGSGG